VWGQDWSDYDGRCVCVYGRVTLYEGKPEVVLESRSNVSLCD
jgi:DNA/RNA endonuclease YhcR with UshA esterase domain